MEPKLLLLGLLRQHQMHGYQLYEFIEHDLSVCTDLKKPTAYYLLGKMAEDGWINEEQVQEGNRPVRRVYSLTEKGEAEYQKLVRANLSSYSPAYFPGDAGLAFLDTLDNQESLDLLSKRRSALLNTLEEIRRVPHHPGSVQLVVEHRRKYLQSELEWLDELIKNLKQRKNL
jgi:DNA-binding PadR family transcriptional regulator